jgi:gliding motility-associated-like protein
MKILSCSILLLLLILCFDCSVSYGQCNTLRSQIDIQFNTNQDCAPVTVTQFRITYFFNAAQNPNTISIEFNWNDPLNTSTLVTTATGLVASAGNTAFTANANFIYADNNGQCDIVPTVSLLINGVVCPTSTQIQTAPFWGRDDQANGVLSIDPPIWDVCFDNPITNAVFTDNSEFNCNISVEPDNPNNLQRHVQFVYGTNHTPASTILNLTLNDGAVRGLTDATGNLVSTSTRGTAGLPITAAYFGPIDGIPFPADGPVSVSFPMNAPADVANAVGNRFEVTLFNWNFCNPWNGDTANPNYDDAILTRAYIQIVAAPQALFVTTDQSGNAKSTFCVNETIYFDNQTSGGGFTYKWDFFADDTGVLLAGSSDRFEPRFVYTSGGDKLIRLTVSNPNAQGSCTDTYELRVTVVPTVIAAIQVTDLSNTVISPDFCQEPIPPFTDFTVRFSDVSTGVATANTRWRWEFYDPSNTLVREEPTGGGFFSSIAGPFDQVYTTKGTYRAVLIVRDDATSCETRDEVAIRVFEKPITDFSFTTVCEGLDTDFVDTSTLNSGTGATITLREWDIDYDGITFTPEAALTNRTTFSQLLSVGIHSVALRTTSSEGCTQLSINDVEVLPKPIAQFQPDVVSGCSMLEVNFQNQSVVGQPAVITSFAWEVDEGGGFVIDSVQRPGDLGFSTVYTKYFTNSSLVDKSVDVRLRVETIDGCEQLSDTTTITINPSPGSGFVALDYSPFGTNCSPQNVSFQVDAVTQSLNPTNYQWQVADGSGVLEDISSGTTPTFSYNFINDTQALRDYAVRLTTTLPGGACSGDSTLTIRISPVPVSTFTLDTLIFDCEKMRIRAEATQVGLPIYAWTVLVDGTPVYNEVSAVGFLEREINRLVGFDQSIEFRLQTTNFANCQSDLSSQQITVLQADIFNTSFIATPLVQTLPNATVQVTNTTNVGDWDYTWDFGDSRTSNLRDPLQHVYESFGNYTIVLTVTNGVCTEADSIAVVIEPIPPIVDFAYSPDRGCSPLTVTFTNLSQYADVNSYYWDFGDGEILAAVSDPVHTYTSPGLYSVSLSASNVSQDTVTTLKQQIIEVFAAPRAIFSVKPTEVYIPQKIVYTRNDSENADFYEWDFGDGTQSTEEQPTHAYTQEGFFDIRLIAQTTTGCSDTLTLKAAVRVIEAGEVLIPNAFSPDASGPGGTGKNDVFIPLLRNVTSFQMTVFNRWGELLFETNDLAKGWDGYYNGKLCQQDVYVYKIKATLEDGSIITRVGDIHLMQ